MSVYIHLFHGRTSPEENLDDWGADGPFFGPYHSVQTTYMFHIKAETDNDLEELFWVGDLVYYDGMYYGDMYISDEVPSKITPYEGHKARPLKNSPITEISNGISGS